ncbi:MAG: flagellar hook protein FlgE [Aquabacterium sp.]|jgi:flagellar hook protein FlgE|nr:MAG: flagellar hook protein FlgE [Aquabacterium sp.]
MGFQQGLSGLNVSSKNLEVIGNNVANANTFGAKTSRGEFADMYATSMNGGGSNNIGIGATVAAVAQQFTQGNITTTENPLDLAINGSGFFQVTDGQNPTTYTRNGQFKLDRDGFLVNNQKHKLMGYPADTQGNILSGTAQPLQLPTAGISPRQTDEITMEVNLDSRDDVSTVAFAIPPVSGSYSNATSQTVYDAVGQDVAVTYYYRKSGVHTWEVYAAANGNTILGSNAAPVPVATMSFNSSGGTPASITWNTAAAGQIDIPADASGAGKWEAISPINLDLTSTTEYGSSFSVTNLTQSGYAPGQLTSISIDSSGVILARYSNGQSKPAGQIELATFRNVQGLQPLGGNEWASTYASGDPIMGTPTSSNFGILQSGALEESNVDLTGELVAMIVAQRTYQANAQTIRAEDQILQTLVNLR